MKIAIVNDLQIAQEILKQVVSSVPHYEIIWTALDGQEAFEKTLQTPPDLILMDLIMPNTSGVEATRKIMQTAPCPILIVTATIQGNANLVYEAMGYGAIDVVRTPTAQALNQFEGDNLLLTKIEQIARIIGKTIPPQEKPIPPTLPLVNGKPLEIVLIGASTGGPQALLTILSQLPKNFPVPIVIAQHIDSEFAPGFATWLDTSIPLKAQIISSNTTPQKGNVYIAATKDHLILSNNNLLTYSPDPLELVYRPSIDVLFKSYAKNFTNTGIAILLTGMGQDGAEGMLELHNKGWITIAQDENSSILFDMPKAAIQQNAASRVLPLDNISNFLMHNFSQPEFDIRKK